MDNIGLIISGNLTGFSRFYASPNANDIYNEAKFDFDYRNYTTFLNSGENAYAISFSPTVISVSLITRILDSFRRPGILVVSLLMHRNKKVEFNSSKNGDSALYKLLIDINNKFYEKNFVNGMVNQNAAVLMQDYYTDILSEYKVSNVLQRSISEKIDVASPNKRIGYISTSEENISKYLSSVCRQSYDGYHHIILAQNAPQNIDETPIETVLYSVSITNNLSIRIPKVKLSDKIYRLSKSDGEIDMNMNFTYQQVINGDASPYIRGELNGDVIELTYRFDKEQKTINFVFKDGTNDISFDQITLVLVDKDGIPTNIPTNPYTFEGKELYEGVKTLQCGNENFVVKQESKNFDLRRYTNGSTFYVQVEQAFRWQWDFGIQNQLKTIIFTNLRTGKRIPFNNVKQFFSELLPGHQEDWTFSIKSDFYDDYEGKLPPIGQNLRFELKPKPRSSQTNPITKTANKTHSISAESRQTLPAITSSTSKKHDGGVHLNANSGSENKTKRNKLQPIIIGGVGLLVIVIVLLLWNLDDFFDYFSKKQIDTYVVATDEDKTIDADVIISLVDASNDIIKEDKDVKFEKFSKYVSCVVTPNEQANPDVLFEMTDTIEYKYHLTGVVSEIPSFEFKIVVSDKDNQIVIAKPLVISSSKLCESDEPLKVVIPLKINTSNLIRYIEIAEIKDFEITNEAIERLKDIEGRRNVPDGEFKEFILNRIDKIIPKKKEEKPKVEVPRDKNKNVTPINEEVSDNFMSNEIKLLISEASPVPESHGKTENQKNIIKKYNQWLRKVYRKKDETQKETIKKQLAGCSTYRGLESVVNTYKGDKK